MQSHDPLVSVVICSYKKAPWLRECVESYVCQSYKNIELIIVNDGSPDDTSEVARALIAQYPYLRMRLIEKANGGVSDARNAGLREAQGRVILTMDGDDMAKPDYIEKAVKGLRMGEGEIFRPHQENFGTKPGSWIPHNYDRFFIRYDNCFPTPSVHDKALFEKTGGFKVCLGYAEDWEYWVGCSRHNPKVVQCDELLTRYRINDTGIAATFIEGKWQDCVAVVAGTNEDLYSVGELLAAHESIPKSAETNIKRMRELDRIHPNEWFLKFFLGLVEEAAGQGEQAGDLYMKSIALSAERNWQPIYRLARLLQRYGKLREAQMLLHETRILRPDMSAAVKPIIDEIGSGLGAAK